MTTAQLKLVEKQEDDMHLPSSLLATIPCPYPHAGYL